MEHGQSERSRWRTGTAGTAVALALGLLAVKIWAVVRVTWFVHTSDYCATNACSGSLFTGVSDGQMLQGEAAFEAAGASIVTMTLSYLPFTVLAPVLVIGLLGIAALAWGWSPATWMGHWRQGRAQLRQPRLFEEVSAHRPVLIAQASLAGVLWFLLFWAVNAPSMLWFTHVVE